MMMKKAIVSTLLLILVTYYTQAQTKVFKQVNDEMSSQFKVITQDNSLVGYLSFTRLEKASADSFNYRIGIMDENLNDIGKVEFRQQGLALQNVSFDQDILCLAYIKSNLTSAEFKTEKEYKARSKSNSTELFFQFLGLDGKIINTHSTSVSLKSYPLWNSTKTLTGVSELKHGVQLKNLTKRGFVCFYGDDHQNNLLVFGLKGELLWQKKVVTPGDAFYMLTSGADIYMLSKTSYVTGKTAVLGGYAQINNEGDYKLTTYVTTDTTLSTSFAVKDDHGNQLKVIAFDNDIVTGKAYLAGCIINPELAGNYLSGRAISKNPYLGVFTININGHKPDEVKKTFTYWSDGSVAGVSQRGLFEQTGSYARFTNAFRDFDGNTYFAGTEMIKRPKWGSIASSVILSPLIVVSPFIVAFVGTSKCKLTDAMLIRQNANGALSVEQSIPADHSRFFRPIAPVTYFDKKGFYSVVNSDSKTNYLIVDDEKDIRICNVNQKKVARTIHHKDGNIKTEVFPAKEGYIMVSEYNKKEKSTKLSIEAL